MPIRFAPKILCPATDGSGSPARRSHSPLRSRRAFTLIELLVVIAIISILISLLLPAIQQAREAARRVQCKNNLAQLSLALQNYAMAHQVLPPGSVNPTGPVRSEEKGYHYSWLVQLLPYIEEGNAFRKFDFSESVYASKHVPIISHAIPILTCPSSTTGGWTTNYVGCHDARETPIDVDNNGVLFLNSSVSFRDVTDGRSHTIFLGETGSPGALGWASGTNATLRNAADGINGSVTAINAQLGDAPSWAQEGRDYGDFEIEETDEEADEERDEAGLTKRDRELLQVGGFSSFHPHGAHFAFGDGSVKFLIDQLDQTTFERLAQRNDGELVDGF